MMELSVTNPTALWTVLGKIFFSDRFEEVIDVKLGDRRFVSIGNTLTVRDWPATWTGKALFNLVGYSPKGYKMDLLRRTYVSEEKWKELKLAVKEDDGHGFSAKGMNFNMSVQRKGGCLSSLHIIRHRGRSLCFVHGKIAEVPRKFMADLMLVRDLLQELSLWPMEVRFMYSVVYYSIVGLRAYVPVLGESNVDLHSLPILDPRNYQASIIEAITHFSRDNFTKEERRKGIWKKIDFTKGEWISPLQKS